MGWLKKKFVAIPLICIVAIFALMLLAIGLIRIPRLQHYAATYAADYFSKTLGTPVTVGGVSLGIFNRASVNTILIRDKEQDTLLYVGALSINLTDWFFLQSAAQLKYVRLEDIVVHIRRDDSTWNFDFLTSNPKSKQAPILQKNKPTVWSLQQMESKNVNVVITDNTTGYKVTVRNKYLFLQADTIQFGTPNYTIKQLNLEEPYCKVEDMGSKLSPNQLRKRADADKKDMTHYLNPFGFNFLVHHFSMKQGGLYIALNNNTAKRDSIFDHHHISIQQLDATAHNVKFFGDTLTANIDSLAAVERSGFVVNKLTTRMCITPRMMEFAKLDIQTPHSHVNGYYAMRYAFFMKDIGYYIQRVKMEGHFSEDSHSQISTQDIGFFAPNIAAWNLNVLFSGNFNGTVDSFRVSNFNLHAGEHTLLEGNITVVGLPDDTAIYHCDNFIVKTDFKDLRTVIPSLTIDTTTINWGALGNVILQLNLNGTTSDLHIDGVATTALGTPTFNMTMQFPGPIKKTIAGEVQCTDFNLGGLLNISKLGATSFYAQIATSNVKDTGYQTNVVGVIAALDCNQYKYQNITLSSVIKNKQMASTITIADSNLTLSANCNIDWSGQMAAFGVHGSLSNCNFLGLHYLKESVNLSGALDLNFSGNTINDIVGYARLVNGRLLHNNKKMDFDSLAVRAFFSSDSVKNITLASNQFEGSLHDFNNNISNIPSTIQFLLHKYMPHYFAATTDTLLAHQHFDFSITTRRFDEYAHIFDNRSNGFDYSNVYGTVNTRKSDISIHAKIINFSFEKYYASDLYTTVKGTDDSLIIHTEFSSAKLNNNISLLNTKTNIRVGNNNAYVQLRTKSKNNLNDLFLCSDIHTFEDGVEIIPKDSYFILNQKKWVIQHRGSLIIRGSNIFAKDIELQQDNVQQITINSQPMNEDGNRNVIVAVRNVWLDDIVKLLIPSLKMEGRTNGTFTIQGGYDNFSIVADLQNSNVVVADESLGNLPLHCLYNRKEKILQFRTSANNNNYLFSIDGFVDNSDTLAKSAALAISINIPKMQLHILRPIVKNIFDNFSGDVAGNLLVTGRVESPDMIGSLHATNTSFTIGYTKVPYRIADVTVMFDNTGIRFNQCLFTDRMGNTGTFSGSIAREKILTNMTFNFEASSNKMELLHTTLKDNAMFYGEAIGSTSVRVNGTMRDPVITIAAKTTDPSNIFIGNTFASKEQSNVAYIRFKKYDKKISSIEDGMVNLTCKMDIDITPLAQIRVALTSGEDEALHANGSGIIKMNYSQSGFTMSGRYIIDTGSYNIALQSFVHKPFKILTGSSVVWTDDPSKGSMDINAQYIANDVSVIDLISAQQLSVASSTKFYRGPMYVTAKLTGIITQPTISFDIDFDANSPVKVDPVFTTFWNTLKANPSELTAQATSLIMLGIFKPYGKGIASNVTGGANSTSNIATLAVNTVTGIFTDAASAKATTMLAKLTKDNTWNINVGNYFYNSSIYGIGTDPTNATATTPTQSNLFNRTNVNFKLNKSFWNEKVIVSAGVNLDVGVGANTSDATTTNTQWLPDINTQIMLSQDRRVRLILFYKNSIDLSVTNALSKVTRTGVNITYTRNFENFIGSDSLDIFMRQKKNKKTTGTKKNVNKKHTPPKPLIPTTKIDIPPLRLDEEEL